MVLCGSLTDILPATVLIMAFTIGGSVLILRLRKMLKTPPKTSITFTMAELKQLRDDGAMSDEEYERAKQSIIDLAKGSTTDSQKTPLK